MNFVPLHCHSHFSLLDGLSKPKDIAEHCANNSQYACALTDHGSISGAAAFIKACKKQNIKSILGCEFYCTESESTLKDKDNLVSHQIILAKNITGWNKLIELVSKSNNKERFYYKPRIDIDMMREICDDNLISFSGHLGSTLHLRSKNIDSCVNYVKLMQDIFGHENFFVEIQSIDYENNEAVTLMDKMREVARQSNAPCVATCDAHYTSKDKAYDHRVLLCSSLCTTIKKANSGDVGLSAFFNSEQFHIPTYEEMVQYGSTEEEIENTNKIAEMCDSYDITNPPQFPKFPDCKNISEKKLLKKLCIDGWYNRKIEDKPNKEEYVKRIQKELQVINDANLVGYFLIVQDYVNWSKGQGWLIGPSRGSAAGSLTSYLLNITSIDPIKHGLIFERFYNAGRNTEDHISLPDIDIDFPIKKRKYVIEYLKEKYGHDRVCQMVTFGRLMGRGALKEVLRIHNACDYETMNAITKQIPQESEISDQLETADETSIIRWTLQHDPKRLSDWCVMDEDGNVSGEYADLFAQAIRLEGTYKSQGKHAAGIVLSAEPLDKVCPMIHDKKGDEKIAGMSMEDLESMGHVKFDVLGVNLLDKLMGVKNLLQFGKVDV